ncbi:MAG: hypothetical protein HY921_05005 [Elusimicrobia bacterium]|nr:hypothetical protein [Elusimicrobiota bacterium]
MNSQKKVQMAVLVGRYSTPLAIILVGLGLFLSQPVGLVRVICVCLLVFGLVFNLFLMRVIQGLSQGAQGLIEFRLWVNLAVNSVMVYFLGIYWSSIWLLLALTPFAIGIYDTRERTLKVSIGVALLLLAIHALRPTSSQAPLEWGIQLAQGAFVILTSLMINELSQLAHSRA